MPQKTLRPQVFQNALLLATALPLLVEVSMAAGVLPRGGMVAEHYLAIVLFVSLAHVPATFYLMLDRDLTRGLTTPAWQLILIPAAFITVLPYILFVHSPRGENDTSDLVLLTVLGYLAWQHWHFGRQNIGVLAFSTMAPEGRRVSSFERLTINGASLGAALGIVGMLGPQLTDTYASAGTSSVALPLIDLGAAAGWALQVALIAGALIYMARYRRTYTRRTALTYFCSVAFFAPLHFYPDGLHASFPAGHGLQYMIFLAYHAMARMHARPPDNGDSAAEMPVGVRRHVIWPCLLLAIFIMGGLFYVTKGETAGLISGLGAASGLFSVPGDRALLILMGLDLGLGCIHFWYDSIIWRIRDPSQRQWLMSRYAFMFERPARSQPGS
ncbi:MAG: hypothetical protein RIC16_09325 [Rhodospirillales bacterium]